MYCSVICLAGYSWSGSSLACISFGNSANWISGSDMSNRLGECIPNQCIGTPENNLAKTLAPYIVPNGSRGNCIDGLSVGSKCSITCNEGYEVYGSEYECKLNSVIVNSGNWKGSEFIFTGGNQQCKLITSLPIQLCSSLSFQDLPIHSSLGSCGNEITAGSTCLLGKSEIYYTILDILNSCSCLLLLMC